MTTAMRRLHTNATQLAHVRVIRPETAFRHQDADRQPFVPGPLVAAVAHDLRNTLAGLILWFDTLELVDPSLAAAEDAQGPTLFRTVLEQIHSLACRSVYLVDDLLDISRLEAGYPLALATTEVDLVDLAQQIVRSRPGAITSERVRLESAQPEIWAWCDADRLGRVVENLLGNALKYSPVDEPIMLRLSEQNIEGRPHAILEVEDRGIGIPADELPRVFDVFQRSRNVGPSTPGSGLGLWVSRAIVARHGGTLSVASSEGQGTTVTLRLPLFPAPAGGSTTFTPPV